MRSLKILPAVAACLVLATPAVAAQTMTHAEARAQMQRYCAENANRVDEAGRTWYATYCGPQSVAVRPKINAIPVAVGFGLIAFAAAIFHNNH